jgi:hypothetical protein
MLRVIRTSKVAEASLLIVGFLINPSDPEAGECFIP